MTHVSTCRVTTFVSPALDEHNQDMGVGFTEPRYSMLLPLNLVDYGTDSRSSQNAGADYGEPGKHTSFWQ